MSVSQIKKAMNEIKHDNLVNLASIQPVGRRSKRNWQSNKIPLSLIGLVWSCLVHATVRWFGLDRANRAFFRYPIASWGVLENSIVFNY